MGYYCKKKIPPNMKVEGEIREEFRSDISIRPAIMLVANCTEQVKG